MRTTFVLAAVLLAPFSPSLHPAEARKPNVVIVLTDDQGYGDLACHGNPFLRPPPTPAWRWLGRAGAKSKNPSS